MTEAVELVYNHSQNINDEWCTPSYIVEAARTVMGGIDVDPASNDSAQETVMANTYFTKENSSLEQPWNGRVWMNPPYSRVIKQFVEKLVTEVTEGRTTEFCVITNNSTDAKWFHSLLHISHSVCFTGGRIAFLRDGNPVGNNTKGQAIFYFGPNHVDFAEAFSWYGTVLRKA